MTNLTSEINLESFLCRVIDEPLLHAKWINTLSCLENQGARKIAACEHPTKVKEEMLKHASEEFRHAHYLKTQIKKVSNNPFPDYRPNLLLGGVKALHYLQKLDARICRILKNEEHLKADELKKAAYILVTYAIELRASLLYPLYSKYLKQTGSKVSVSSIIHEEEEHLKEMRKELEDVHDGQRLLQKAIAIEEKLFMNWLDSLS